ncbi:BglG family transcription antiterminator [Vallitalea guaymasensis]|uniref:BglG family transcription antiterminator n=1 Tax=Vallitalea guaymasensis TaxID=1185412 RepID=A0A8J8MET5_9FIRM|nr:BglG family transcription antiterminator [Vallitalea guaymasensis]QUH31498.1 BglG family transcription antiterminator [Vallitalea guaymasensis]
MYYLNKRQIEIITYLINKNKYVSVKTIAAKFDVSIRTIRYDLELIDDWLNENKATLVKIPNKGIELKVITDKTLLLEKLKFLSIENRVLSERERVRYIVLELLMSEKELTIEDISSRLYLSKNTVIKILKDVKRYLKDNKLQTEKVYGKGIRIVGNEVDKRSLLLELFSETLSINNIILTVKNKSNYKELITLWENNYRILSINEVEQIFDILKDIEETHSFYLTDIALTRLVFYLTISINRIKNNHIIKKQRKQIRELREYKIANIIADRLKKYDVVFNKEEIDEIAAYIIESKSYNTINDLKSMKFTQVFNKEIINCTQHIIKYFEKELKVDFHTDTQLVNGLALHLKSALNRIKNNKQIVNKYIDSIKEKYPLVFQIAKESIGYLEKTYEIKINDEEIGYITLHIRSAYERLSNKGYSASALVICTEGVSILSMLTTKLKKVLPELNIIETCSIYDYEKYKDEIDVVITTNEFKLSNVDVIKVSPFLENDEIYDVRNFIIRLNKFKQIYKYSISDRVLGGKIVMLKDVMNEEVIELGVSVDNWEEAIMKAGEPLVRQGNVEQAYIDNMIQAVKDLGPYIVIMPGVAFAHARPDENVKSTCMSMITLEEPVNFGSEQNDPVSIVFAFAAPNSNEHMVALQDLARFLSVEENIELLKNVNDKQTILDKLLDEETV